MTAIPAELRERLKTVHTYAVTPFRDEDVLAVDHGALASNIEFLIDRGITVVAVGGGTGEADALSPSEFVDIARTAVETSSGRAVIVATVPGNLSEASELLGRYGEIGVDVVLALPPLVRWKVPPVLDGVIDYYEALGARTSLPLMPYNTQGWSADVFGRLAGIDAIVGVKDPCVDDVPFFQAIAALGDRFVWIGNKRHDPGVVHLRYQMGMQGFTSGMTNFLVEPELLMHEAAVRRDWDRVVALQALAADLERARRSSDDAAMIKACMDVVGLRGGAVRPPRRPIEAGARAALRPAIDALVEALAMGALEGRVETGTVAN